MIFHIKTFVQVLNYEETEEGKIDILIEKCNVDFVASAISYGKPFSVDDAPTPDLLSSLENRKIGGLGVYFMKQLMDQVSYVYKDGVGTLTMTKYSKNRV
ncbi:MAG: ATP-binding protein [Nitrospirae bacterium]|nr:ATP-binding protein [Nitrospirota bacterium]